MFVLVSLLTACGNRSLASTDWPGMTVQGDKAYLAAGTYVYAVNLENGLESTTTQDGKVVPLRFPLDSKGGPFFADPAFTSADQMIIGSANISDRTKPFPLYSVNAATMTTSTSATNSTTMWPYQNQAKDIWLGGALVLNDVIYAPNSDGGLYAFDLNGNMKQKFEASDSLWSSPVTDGQVIYLSSMDHNVYAIDPANMSQYIWKTELDSSITGSPAVKDGSLFVGTIGGSVYSLDAKSGNIIWQKKFEGGIADQVTLSGGRVYFGVAANQTGTIYALNASDGSSVWNFDAGGAVTASPLVTDSQVVFVTETGTVRALDLDAKPLWMQTLDAKLYSTPVAAGDLILVAPMGKQNLMLVAYDASGAQKWIFSPAK